MLKKSYTSNNSNNSLNNLKPSTSSGKKFKYSKICAKCDTKSNNFLF